MPFLGIIVKPQSFQRIEAESRRKVAVIVNDDIVPVPCENQAHTFQKELT